MSSAQWVNPTPPNLHLTQQPVVQFLTIPADAPRVAWRVVTPGFLASRGILGSLGADDTADIAYGTATSLAEAEDAAFAAEADYLSTQWLTIDRATYVQRASNRRYAARMNKGTNQ